MDQRRPDHEQAAAGRPVLLRRARSGRAAEPERRRRRRTSPTTTTPTEPHVHGHEREHQRLLGHAQLDDDETTTTSRRSACTPTPTRRTPAASTSSRCATSATAIRWIRSDCKYDAFKVKSGAGKVQAVLSGTKYFDASNGQLDANKNGLKNSTITITGTDGTTRRSRPTAQVHSSFTVPARSPAAGTTTYTVKEVQQADWSQRRHHRPVGGGRRRDRRARGLHLHGDHAQRRGGRRREAERRPLHGEAAGVPPNGVHGTNAQGQSTQYTVVVQDADSGLASISGFDLHNATAEIFGFSVDTKLPVTIVATRTIRSSGARCRFARHRRRRKPGDLRPGGRRPPAPGRRATTELERPAGLREQGRHHERRRKAA